MKEKEREQVIYSINLIYIASLHPSCSFLSFLQVCFLHHSIFLSPIRKEPFILYLGSWTPPRSSLHFISSLHFSFLSKCKYIWQDLFSQHTQWMEEEPHRGEERMRVTIMITIISHYHYIYIPTWSHHSFRPSSEEEFPSFFPFLIPVILFFCSSQGHVAWKHLLFKTPFRTTPEWMYQTRG